MKTELVLIMDRSGSMHDIQKEMEGGINSFVDEQKKGEDECVMTVVRFDTEYELLHSGAPIAEIPHIHLEPRGMTALFDAVGKTLVTVRERTKPEDRVIVLVVTDGEENQSVEYRGPEGRARVLALVEECKKLDWQFVFLGADMDAFAGGASVGFDHGKTLSLDKSSASVMASFAHTSANASAMRSGAASSMDYSSDQREDVKKGEGVSGTSVVTPD